MSLIVLYLGRREEKVSHIVIKYILFRFNGRSNHCSEKQRNLIKKVDWRGEMYKVQQIIGCSAKMISNALKWQQNLETRKKISNYC